MPSTRKLAIRLLEKRGPDPERADRSRAYDYPDITAGSFAEAPVAVAEPQEAAVCATELLERIDGDRAFLSELLALFRDDYPVQVRTAREAVKTGNAEALQRSGHALKGALANLAAPASSRLAGQLESMGRAGDTQFAAGTLADMEKELERVVEELESLCMETVN